MQNWNKKTQQEQPFQVIVGMLETVYHAALTSSKSDIKRPEQCVRSVQGLQWKHQSENRLISLQI